MTLHVGRLSANRSYLLQLALETHTDVIDSQPLMRGGETFLGQMRMLTIIRQPSYCLSAYISCQEVSSSACISTTSLRYMSHTTALKLPLPVFLP